MKSRTRAVSGLFLAVLGVSTAAFLRATEIKSLQPSEKEQPTIDVVVATRDLPRGIIVSSSDVKVVKWPAAIAPPNSARTPEAVVGRGVNSPIWRDEPMLEHRLGDAGSGAGLPVMISAGQRALSIRVDEVIGIAGFIQPGAHVDVLVTAGDGDEARSAVVLQDVTVLATGQRLEPDSAREPQTSAVITLLVTPNQAELLTLAANEGRIQLALRHPLDSTPTPTSGAGMAQLTPGSRVVQPVRRTTETVPGPRREAAPTRSSSYGVEVINGSNRAVTTFKDNSQ